MRSSLNKKPANSRTARDRLQEFLRARGLRMTAERETLLHAAQVRSRHFTLDELVDEVTRRDIRASRATMYRSLPILIEAGLLQPVLVSDGPRRFELAFGRRHHDHLVCRQCGRVVEFRSSLIEREQVAIAARHGFSLSSHLHELVGDCPTCRRKSGDPPGASGEERRPRTK